MNLIEAVQLNQDNFHEFGRVIGSAEIKPTDENDEYAWYEGFGEFEEISCIGVNILKCKKRAFKLEKLESHQRTPEAIIPLGGEALLLAVAPPGVLDETKIKVFLIPEGKAVFLNEGVWHFIPYPLGEKDINCVVTFRQGTGENDISIEELKHPAEIAVSDCKK